MMIGRFEQWCCHCGVTENSGICGKSTQFKQTRAVTPAVFPSALMRTIKTAIVCALLLVVIPIDAVAQNKTEPGTEFRDCETCPLMIEVPSGSYIMGSPTSEEGRQSGESPQHQVTISYPFAVGKFEVTFREWDACVSEGGCSRRPHDEGFGRGSRPVINVSWFDAKEYVNWLSRKTGEQYRLLSESEWEYVARAGTIGPFHFGSTISTDQANYSGEYYYTYSGGHKGINREKTVPVGSFPGNAFGLHDVHGNVWEWVEDCWQGSYDDTPSDGSAWISSDRCGGHVLRGGSWRYGPRDLRSAIRGANGSGTRYSDIGFRVARTI